ncbi:MAG: tRNA lysidine(34) synthetase TilS [Vicinamibacterales bacterium]
MLIVRVTEAVERDAMFPRGIRAGVAVSGGADSVALLHLLAGLAPSLGIALKVLHVDHGLRGEESRQDAVFVEALAARLDLAFEARRVDTASAARGRNIEETARRLRREFFLDQMHRGEVARVALGHTRSDQAETVLFRILRGSGLSGLAGMRPVTSDGFVRPLLGVRREELRAYLSGQGIEWREDSTNTEPRFARNRIRNSLLPCLEREWNPRLTDALARLAAICRDEESYWDGVMAKKPLTRRDGGVVLPAAELASLPRAEARRLVRRAIAEVRRDPRGIDFDHIEAILEAAAGRRGSGTVHAEGVTAVRSGRLIRVSAGSAAAATFNIPLTLPGRIDLPGWDACLTVGFQQERNSKESVYNVEEECSELDWEKITQPLTLRSWRAGDRYRPAGRRRVRKLKDLFQEARVPSWERHRWPIIIKDDTIVWAYRFGPSEGLQKTRTTRHVLYVRVLRRSTCGETRRGVLPEHS